SPPSTLFPYTTLFRSPIRATATRAWPSTTGWPSTAPATDGPATPSRPSRRFLAERDAVGVDAAPAEGVHSLPAPGQVEDLEVTQIGRAHVWTPGPDPS